ncbi:MAG: ROK family protein [Bryobacteraceae bacterium]
MSVALLGAIEAGGTKFICGVGTSPSDIQTIQIATTTPAETTETAIAFLRERAAGVVGIASFGPVDLAAGRITSTPKAGWRNFDLADTVRRGLGVPVAFDTDVNGAALGEARWGAARGVSDFLYLTVGTGIGGGAMVNGALLHGLSHPEMGHIRIPHDRVRDSFAGLCPFHGDCLEGLASGPAIEARWKRPARELAADHEAWVLEAHYLALGIANWIYTLSPKLILIGGGVAEQKQLFPMIRAELVAMLNGYVETPGIQPPELGPRAGVLGALAMAELISTRS